MQLAHRLGFRPALSFLLAALTCFAGARGKAQLPPSHGVGREIPPALELWQAPSADPAYAKLPVQGLVARQPATPATLPHDEALPAPIAAEAAPPAAIEPSPPTESPLAENDLQVAPPTTWYEPAYWFGPAPWDTGVELGINGSTGNNESVSIRAGGYIKRESRFSKLDLSTSYNRTTTSGDATQNNAQLDARNDWLLDENSPWTLYGTGNLFYDQFQAFDVQVSANTGIGYRFIRQPGFDLIGRFGGGTSREIGGPDDRWVPESLLGLEYSQQIATNQKLYSKVDYYPDLDELGEFRLVSDTGWEIELVQPSNLSLKVSATDRYDSTPNGAEPNLLNYSVLLLLKL